MSTKLISMWLSKNGEEDYNGDRYIRIEIDYRTELLAKIHTVGDMQPGLEYLYLGYLVTCNGEERWEPLMQYDVLNGQIQFVMYRHYAVEPTLVTCPNFAEEFAATIWEQYFARVKSSARRSMDINQSELRELADNRSLELPNVVVMQDYSQARVEVEKLRSWLRAEGKWWEDGSGKFLRLREDRFFVRSHPLPVEEETSFNILQFGHYVLYRSRASFHSLVSCVFAGTTLLSVFDHGQSGQNIMAMTDEQALNICQDVWNKHHIIDQSALLV